MRIGSGNKVSVHYTLTLDTGEIIESSPENDPLVYTHGSGELMPGLEEHLEGMKQGEERTGILAPEKMFGPHDPEAMIEIPKDHLPPEAWRQGAMLQASGPNGERIDGRVLELKENMAVVDFNHPLANMQIHFTLRVVDIR